VHKLNWSKVEMVKSVLEQDGEGGRSVRELNWNKVERVKSVLEQGVRKDGVEGVSVS
jgi:hypothetical protein